MPSGVFSGTGVSSSFAPSNEPVGGVRSFAASIVGAFTGSITLQRTYDNGSNWMNVSVDALGTAATYTAPVTVNVDEPATNAVYRWNCTALSVGTPTWRFDE